ncbi:MAG: Rieske 2Fe-2S domain-containing protein [Gammaproteobacteria bacterium]|nr:Rieske 2Fe-2S domain-containing protein [Gammaproteobacteria bacterium]
MATRPTDVRRSDVGIDRSKALEPRVSRKDFMGNRYTSREFMDLEWQRMWTRVWMVGGLVAQLPERGDYITHQVGRESILMIRGFDDRIRAFYNICQHRGNLLTTSEEGSVIGDGTMQCAYHGWKWAADGALVHVEDSHDFLDGNPCDHLRLNEIPCDTWAGMVWFNMDKDCVGLREFLAPMADQLDSYEIEKMTRTDWVTMELECNWKVVQDNFNESYHVRIVHPEARFFLDDRIENTQFDLYPNGHCRMLMPGGAPGPTVTSVDELPNYVRSELKFWELDVEDYRDRDLTQMRFDLWAQKRKLGAAKGFDFSRYSDEQLTDNYHYTLFPNLTLSMKPDGIIWLRAEPHPTDPGKCLFDMWNFQLFPQDGSSIYNKNMQKLVNKDYQAEHVVGKQGEVSVGPGIDQDVSIWTTQQAGLASQGFYRPVFANQERRIPFHHDVIDRYLFGEENVERYGLRKTAP